ncbi:MAG: FtsX-like permease family protein [Planctomycetaceae bacterium]|nr:FtsX-like permease family protein [Planctomycetaceae bacterium]
MYKLLLCVRYLRTKYIALACIISVMLGVATMIVVNSVMAGFTTEMRDRLHNFLADIVIESRGTSGIPDSDAQMQVVREAAGDYIEAMTATIEIPGMLTFTDPYSGETFTQPIQIQGIDPEGKAEVGPLPDYLDSYNPVVEDGKEVRPALRSRDEPLGWELTASGKEHHRLVQERKQLYLNENLQPDFLPVSPDESLPSVDPPAENAPAKSGEAAPQPEAPAEAPQFDVKQSDEQAAIVADADAPSSSTDVMGQDEFLTSGQTSAPAVRDEPLPARVYIGEGLISFLVRNQETGKSQKIMMVEPGDDVILSTVTAGRPPEVTKFQATVVDTFRSGMSEYDSSIVLMNIEALQKYRGMHLNKAITAIHIRLKSYADAPKVLAALERAFPPGMVSIKTWEEKQGLLLSAVEVETAILNVLLFLIIAVAGFGILAIFYMIVVEKTRDIGILKSLGASSTGVMSIFLSYGLGLGIVGSSAGVFIGLLFVRYINEIEDALSWITGRKVFDEKIYYFFEIPTYVNPWMVFWVAAGAISIAVLASIMPARRAARLHPVRALRYE